MRALPAAAPEIVVTEPAPKGMSTPTNLSFRILTPLSPTDQSPGAIATASSPPQPDPLPAHLLPAADDPSSGHKSRSRSRRSREQQQQQNAAEAVLVPDLLAIAGDDNEAAAAAAAAEARRQARRAGSASSAREDAAGRTDSGRGCWLSVAHKSTAIL